MASFLRYDGLTVHHFIFFAIARDVCRMPHVSSTVSGERREYRSCLKVFTFRAFEEYIYTVTCVRGIAQEIQKLGHKTMDVFFK